MPSEASVRFHDKEPPDDDSRLEVSYLRLPPIDWSGCKLAALVETAISGVERPIHTWGRIMEMRRGHLDLAWREVGFVDPGENREARSRLCVARRGNLQCLITFDFWAADLPRCEAAWETVLETLELGEFVADPQRGPMVS